MEEKDLEVDDILLNSGKNKNKLNSNSKGKRVENSLCKVLNKRFSSLLTENLSWGNFNRSLGSGNRWSQVNNMSNKEKSVFSGDIVCPDNFNFVIESKGGYNDIDIISIFNDGNKEIDSFIEQSSNDAERASKKSIIIWKKNRKNWVCIIKKDNLPNNEYLTNITFYIKYKEWIILDLMEFLELEDSYFFNN